MATRQEWNRYMRNEWTKRGEFTWHLDDYVVQWDGMPASYSASRNGTRIATFETPEEAKAYVALVRSGQDKATVVATRIIAAIREHGPSREVIAARLREAYGNDWRVQRYATPRERIAQERDLDGDYYSRQEKL